jgi:hypothetical protein
MLVTLTARMRREAVRASIVGHPTFFCPISNECLDVDRAILLDHKGKACAVVSATGWRKILETKGEQIRTGIADGSIEAWFGKDGSELDGTETDLGLPKVKGPAKASRKLSITIDGDQGLIVDAFFSRCGRLAIHKTADGVWTVTHVPTGLGAACRKTKALALIVRKALETLGDAWDFTEPEDCRPLNDAVKAILAECPRSTVAARATGFKV